MIEQHRAYPASGGQRDDAADRHVCERNAHALRDHLADDPRRTGAERQSHAQFLRALHDVVGDRNLITREELSADASINAQSVLDAIRSLRPQFLTERGKNSHSDDEAGRVHVSLDGGRMDALGEFDFNAVSAGYFASTIQRVRHGPTRSRFQMATASATGYRLQATA